MLGCGPLPAAAEGQRNKKLTEALEWWLSNGHCSECHKAHWSVGKPPPDCSTCSFPGLLESNALVVMLVAEAQPVMWDGMGGVLMHNVKELALSKGICWSSVIDKTVEIV